MFCKLQTVDICLLVVLEKTLVLNAICLDKLMSFLMLGTGAGELA